MSIAPTLTPASYTLAIVLPDGSFIFSAAVPAKSKSCKFARAKDKNSIRLVFSFTKPVPPSIRLYLLNEVITFDVPYLGAAAGMYIPGIAIALTNAEAGAVR